MSPKPESAMTYDELKAKRAAEWNAAQGEAARRQAELYATLLKMPDVANAPSPEIPWSSPGIRCRACQTEVFRVARWVTVNGVKYRAELHCHACGEEATWDWTANRWVEDMLAEERTAKARR